MPERICKVALPYAGRDIGVGERFNVEPKDVELLLLLGWIEPAEGENGYTARDMTAEQSAGYRTRDMTRNKRRAG